MKPGIAERNKKIINRVFEIVKEKGCTYTEAFEIVSDEEKNNDRILVPNTIALIFYRREAYGTKKV